MGPKHHSSTCIAALMPQVASLLALAQVLAGPWMPCPLLRDSSPKAFESGLEDGRDLLIFVAAHGVRKHGGHGGGHGGPLGARRRLAGISASARYCAGTSDSVSHSLATWVCSRGLPWGN